METVIERLQMVFRDTFDDDTIELTREMDSSSIDGWDSLSQISILAATEDEFKISLSISDVRKLKNVGELVDLITNRMR